MWCGWGRDCGRHMRVISDCIVARVAFVALLSSIPSLVPCAATASGVNVESRRPKITRPGAMFEAQGDFGFRQGNVNLLETGLKARIAYQHDDHLIFYFHDSAMNARTLARNGGSVSQLGRRGSRFVNRHMGHLRYSLRLMDWFRAEALNQVEMNEFLLTRTRLLLGVVGRFTVFSNEVFGMYAGPGYLAEYEELDPRTFVAQPSGRGADNWWHRFSGVLTLSLRLTDRLAMQSTTYVQPRIDDPADVLVLNDNSLDVELAEHFQLRLTAGLRHDSASPTYCAADLAAGVCPVGSSVRLVSTDVSLSNALAVRF